LDHRPVDSGHWRSRFVVEEMSLTLVNWMVVRRLTA
jgi:hypothetical protein